MRPRRIAVVVILGLLALLSLPAGAASAHPLGNFTVNHYDGLHFFPDHVDDFSVIDTAEIPTLQTKASVDTNHDGTVDAAEMTAYAAARCARIATTVRLVVNDQPATFAVMSSFFEYRPGAINLKISRLTCNLTAPIDIHKSTVASFRDDFDSSGVGWHEITAIATNVALKDSPVPATSVSNTLLRYPDDTLQSPLQVRSAVFSIEASGASSYGKGFHVAGTNPLARALNRLNKFFNNIVGRDHLTFGVGLLAVLVAALLGAGHALLPGHGKTIMAAYLVGRRGRMRDVVAIGATVTTTHTAGVIIVGLLISASSTFAPTAANKWLGVASGLLVVAVGITLLRTALSGKPQTHRHGLFGGGHVHDHGDHDHGDHDHDGHDHDGHTHTHPPILKPGWSGLAVAPQTASTGGATLLFEAPTLASRAITLPTTPPADTLPETEKPLKPYSRAGLIGLGIAGGLVPSPSALVVLLGAIALGRTAFGVLLVLAYGAGLALTLTVAGLLLIPLRARIERMAGGTKIARATRLLAVLPVVTASLVMLVGLGLAARSAAII